MKRFLLILFVLLPALALADYVPAVHKNGKWGFKESKYSDKFIIKPKFENAHPFAGDYAFVCKKGLWGVIGKDGKFVVAPTYSSASQPYNGITIVQLGSKYGLVKDCKDILSIEYESIEHLRTGAFRLKKDGRVGLADASGKIFLPVEYQDIAIYNNGYKLKANNLFGLADANGKIFIPVEYEDIANCGNGYKLQANGRVGLADANGNIVLETKYKKVLYLQNNTFAVYSNKLEFINSEGKVVGQPNNVLLYTSNNGKTIDRGERIGKIVYNTCHNGQGIMVFDKPITSIERCAFKDCAGLTSVTIPNSVTEIGSSTFCNCDGLTSITIPNSVTSIGGYAFSGCDGLTSVTIPNSVTSIGEAAFYDCDGLTSVTIPDSVTEIRGGVFWNCDNLTRVNVNISDLARYCTSNPMHSIPGEKHLYLNGKEITNLVIPDCITEIGDSAFYGCSSLTSVTIGNSVTEIGDSAFYGCSSLTSVTIGNSVTEIGDEAFRGCTGLTSITIPNSVTSIGDGAFYDCVSLEAVYLNATIPPYLGEDVFDYYGGRICCPIYIPSSSLSRYKGVGGNWWSYYQYLRGR